MAQLQAVDVGVPLSRRDEKTGRVNHVTRKVPSNSLKQYFVGRITSDIRCSE